MEFFVNCNTAGLAPYNTALTRDKAEHLYRRLGFSASVDTINQAIGMNSSTLVDQLVAEAVALPTTTPPVWAFWTHADYPADNDTRNAMRAEQFREWTQTYTKELLQTNLRDRMSFFWSNHFVTEEDKYNCVNYLFEYTNCLQRNALGDFKAFTSEIGLTSAMLFYLDGAYNRESAPNENYARELYELFCLGEGNGYTEQDVIETARALTGYVNYGQVGCSLVTFDPTQFDATTKTIFGQTGAWGYTDVIDILFNERPNEIGIFIAQKLYTFFIHPDPDTPEAQTIISGLAATFIQSNFQIAPMVAQLLKSAHFFDDTAVGVIIKSPFDLFLNLINETSFSYSDANIESIIDVCEMLSQRMFNPFDVAGWQRNRSWINTNFMIGRWLTSEMFIDLFWQADPEQFRAFGIACAGPQGGTTNDPTLIANAIINKILPKGLLADELQNAIDTFLDEALVEYYAGGSDPSWNMYWTGADQKVYLLLQHLVKQPEFQLK